MNINHKHRLYRIYHGVVNRCTKPKDKRFHYYGGRGITVCEEWLRNKESFFEWALSNGYSDSLTLDRRENNKGYSPENCRWATKKTQANNTRATLYVVINNVTLPLTEACEIFHISYSTLYKKIHKDSKEEVDLYIHRKVMQHLKTEINRRLCFFQAA